MERPHKSDTVGKIAEALAKAQGTMEAAKKSSQNPHYGSKYADLAECLKAAQPYLSDNGLAVVQATSTDESGHVELITELIHISGEWFRSYWPIRPVKLDPQGYGSALSYARRYCFQAIIGQPSKDDDANAASGRDVQARTPFPSKGNGNVRPATSPGLEKVKNAAKNGRVAEVPAQAEDLANVRFEHPETDKSSAKKSTLQGRTLGDIYRESPAILHKVMASPAKRAMLSPALRIAIGDFLLDRELEGRRELSNAVSKLIEHRERERFEPDDDEPTSDMHYENDPENDR